MHDKRYRDGYVAAHTRQVLAKQMREFRGKMPQTEFANLIDKRQTVVSRLENPSYSGWTLGTLFEIASKLDVAVFVRFVDFATFLKYSGDQSETALHPAEYNQHQVDDFARSAVERDLTEADILRALEILRRPGTTETHPAKKPEGFLARDFIEDRISAVDKRIQGLGEPPITIPKADPASSAELQSQHRAWIDNPPEGLGSWN
jgi:hypothetical protein